MFIAAREHVGSLWHRYDLVHRLLHCKADQMVTWAFLCFSLPTVLVQFPVGSAALSLLLSQKQNRAATTSLYLTPTNPSNKRSVGLSKKPEGYSSEKLFDILRKPLLSFQSAPRRSRPPTGKAGKEETRGVQRGQFVPRAAGGWAGPRLLGPRVPSSPSPVRSPPEQAWPRGSTTAPARARRPIGCCLSRRPGPEGGVRAGP